MTVMEPDLQVTSTLPALSFNFEGLKAWAHDVTNKYTDLIVTEESVRDIKKDMARINATKAALEEARKRAVKQVSAPIDQFQQQVREITAVFARAYSGLSEQVKGIEARQREERKTSVRAMIAEAFAERPALTPFAIPIRDEWLNVSAAKKSIREAIAAVIEAHAREEAEQKRVEQARQERRLAIENHVKALNARHGLDLPLARFMTPALCSLDTPLDASFQGINAAFAAEQARRDAAQPRATRPVSSAPVAPHAPDNPAHTAAPPEPAPAGRDIRLMLMLSYAPDKEASIQIALSQLKELCTSCGVRRI